ncbi:phage baseplate assembly protein V [Acinetobacter baumannii]|uniref:phage baseplate assembly protein V n=1 Tax=Acinetobacter baumannii TaxID=470 RepID=UPI0007434C3E|nr:phage baseplate assembly protein V [Acinetobacter baumannii]ATP85853.1 Phage-related baseplate assembly protein [Acinetobacter baumannii]MCF4279118.1 phage baseplate assembly protein V [Acinetobacter baumannii]MCF4286828.1 phage baseplate assembly protein V [Acinetobacter baumannii]MCF4297812.1 phage baseplate assembly protein V [Acinetobacter baumannii]MCF4394814.1 phage baseplate assembly protein V [Acinetobacter baumannii]
MNADINRRLENLIRFGKIKTVNPSNPIPLVTVDLDDIVTPEIRFFNARSGDDSTWDPPSLDEEVMVISPCGEIGPTSVVFYGLYNNEHPAPSDDLNKKIRVFADGCIIAYDIAAHHLSAILPSGGKAIVTADGGITVNGDTTINGNLQINGSTAMTGNNTVGGSQLVQGSSHSTGAFSTEADVKAGSISLKEHKHPGDSGGTTGGPIP